MLGNKYSCPFWINFARGGVGFGRAACPLTPELGRHPANYAERHIRATDRQPDAAPSVTERRSI